ncbi:hypothetical protein [Brevibacillus agri]|nr:hypothetical protein [Brevibacillus agri]MED3498132.1 hypothetical protein [Brevibacillus agri]
MCFVSPPLPAQLDGLVFSLVPHAALREAPPKEQILATEVFFA